MPLIMGCFLFQIQARCMKDLNFAKRDLEIPTKRVFFNAFIFGILPPLGYSTVVWILALKVKKEV